MIGIEKLSTLPRKTRLRKIITLLQEMEYEEEAGNPADENYLKGILDLLSTERDFADWLYGRIEAGLSLLAEAGTPGTPGYSGGGQSTLRICSDVRFGLQQYFGIEPADWDMRDRRTGLLKKEGRQVLPIQVYLEDLRSPFNVGSIFRTAESFGVEKILLSPATPTPEHKRVRRTSMGCTDIVAWERHGIDYCENRKNVFVLEVGGVSVHEFPFPPSGIVILGSEELGVSPEALGIADKSLGRVGIPTGGVKGSLNVSVAFGILISAWFRDVAGKE